MSKKYYTLNVEIPDGKDIDFDKSTLKNIVFKDIETIKWDNINGAVEINCDGEHFLLDAENPAAMCNWHDAIRYCDTIGDPGEWYLPSKEQLLIIAKHINEINNIIKENCGFELDCTSWYWADDKEVIEYANCVTMNGTFDWDLIEHYHLARPVACL